METEAWKKEFSVEELQAMGETAEITEPGPETPAEEKPAETEQVIPEQEQKAETEEKPGDAEEAEPEPEEGKPVPYDRFKKVYGQAKTHERELSTYKEKLDLFKRDPDEFYSKYPDERPADWKPATERQTTETASSTPPPTKILSMEEIIETEAKVNDPTKPNFHGKTLEQLMEMGPRGIAAAQDYYRDYVDSVKDDVRKAKEAEESQSKALRDEDDRFMDGQAQSLFQRPLKDLDKDEKAKVDKVVSDTLAWMKKNGRMAYKLEDAYKIMTYEESLQAAEARGASSLVEHAKKGNVRSVAASAGTVPTDPYAKFIGMSEGDLSKMVMEMSEGDFDKFLAKATRPFERSSRRCRTRIEALRRGPESHKEKANGRLDLYHGKCTYQAELGQEVVDRRKDGILLLRLQHDRNLRGQLHYRGVP